MGINVVYKSEEQQKRKLGNIHSERGYKATKTVFLRRKDIEKADAFVVEFKHNTL